MTERRRRWVALALCVAVAGCGSSSRSVGDTATPRKPALPPVNPEALVQFDAAMRALRLGGPGAADKALPRLEAAVELDATLWEAHHNLGAVHWRRGDDDRAAAAFSSALEVNPAHRTSLLARAEAYRRAGRFDEARDDYRNALQQQPDDVATRVRLASLLREDGKPDDALDAAREALRYGNDPHVLVELGLIYLAQGRDELAELVLEKAVQMDEKLPAAWNALALVSMERGADQQAFERFDRASGLDPAYRDARFNKASVLMSAGDYAAAKRELEAVVELDRDDFGALVALGVAHRALGQYPKARASWETVVKRAPQRSRARGDALFNLAVLAMDFGDRDAAAARAALDRYLQEAPRRHGKRTDAEARVKELGQ